MFAEDADGAFVTSADTDAQGAATIVVRPGGMITTLGEGGGEGFTVLGLADGDSVRMPGSSARLARLVAPDSDLSVTLPAAFAGADGYRLETQCGGETTPNGGATIAVAYDSDCLDIGQRPDVVAWAVNSSGAALAFSAEGAVDPAATTVLPAWTPLASMSTMSFELTHGLEGATLKQLDILPLHASTPFQTPTGPTIAMPVFPASGELIRHTVFDPTFIDAIMVEARVALDLVADPKLLHELRYARRDPTRADVVVDLSTDALPHPDGVAWETGADLAASSISWTLAGAGADAVLVEVAWTHDDNGTPRTRRWSWLAPPDGAGPIGFPKLPAPYDALLPVAGDTPEMVRVSAIRSEGAADYHAYAAAVGLGPPPDAYDALSAMTTHTLGP